MYKEWKCFTNCFYSGLEELKKELGFLVRDPSKAHGQIL